MTDAERIQTIKSQTLATLEQITSSPKPSYSINGQSVSWGDYLRQLRETIEWCDKQLNAEAPYEIHSQAFT